jgi:beta-lactamase superfamily II metal-dependent hydrolase
VRELWLAPQSRGWDLSTIAAVAGGLRRGTSIRPIAAGEELRLGGTSLQIAGLYGSEAASDPGGVLSFGIARGPDSAFLAGTVSGSQQLGESGRQYGGRALIVDRPGLVAAARSDLLQQIAAEAAIVSPGRTMREDSAARRDLSGLDVKIPTFETDADGAVTVTLRGGSIEIRTFRRERIGGIRGR